MNYRYKLLNLPRRVQGAIHMCISRSLAAISEVGIRWLSAGNRVSRPCASVRSLLPKQKHWALLPHPTSFASAERDHSQISTCIHLPHKASHEEDTI